MPGETVAMKKFKVLREDMNYAVELYAVDEEHARDIIAAVHSVDPPNYSPNYEWANECVIQELN